MHDREFCDSQKREANERRENERVSAYNAYRDGLKIKYAGWMVNGCNFKEEKAAIVNFEPLAPLSPLVEYKKTYEKLLACASAAIKSKNVDALFAYLGPPLYQERQKTNHKINLLRWKWLEAKKQLVLYKQEINLMVLYGRKLICDKHIATYLKNKIKEKPQAAEYQHKYQEIERIFEREGLIAYYEKLKEIYGSEVLKEFFRIYAKDEALQGLGYIKTWRLKNLLSSDIQRVPAETVSKAAILFGQTFFNSGISCESKSESLQGEEKIQGQSACFSGLDKEPKQSLLILSPIAAMLLDQQVQNNMFKNPKTQAVVSSSISEALSRDYYPEALSELLLAYEQAKNDCAQYEKTYQDYLAEYSVNEKDLIKKYKENPSNAEHLKREGLAIDQVIQSQIGALSLADNALKYLENILNQDTVIHQANELFSLELASVNEQKSRLQMSCVLIHHGCDPFSSNDHLLRWQELSAILEEINCYMPVAEAVRNVLLTYCNQSAHRQNSLNQQRLKAVTVLIQMLWDSQKSAAREEVQLIEKMKTQIKTEPRGLFKQSSLYAELQHIMDRIGRNELLVMRQEQASELKEMDSGSLKNSFMRSSTFSSSAAFTTQPPLQSKAKLSAPPSGLDKASSTPVPLSLRKGSQ